MVTKTYVSTPDNIHASADVLKLSEGWQVNLFDSSHERLWAIVDIDIKGGAGISKQCKGHGYSDWVLIDAAKCALNAHINKGT